MSVKIVCQNKKAYFDYFMEETHEAGIVLTGGRTNGFMTAAVVLDKPNAAITMDMTHRPSSLAYQKNTRLMLGH